jgi:hypothetical protein
VRVRYAVWGFISGLSLWPLPGSVRAQPGPSQPDGATSTSTSAEPTLDVVDIRAPERREGPLVPRADAGIPLSGRTVRYETHPIMSCRAKPRQSSSSCWMAPASEPFIGTGISELPSGWNLPD